MLGQLVQRFERAGVFDIHLQLDLAAAIDQPPALDHVQSGCVRRAEQLHMRPIVQPDRIDDQRVAVLVMADRLAVP